MSVIIKAKSYTKGTNTELTVSTDIDSKKIVLAKEVDTYLVVLDAGNASAVKFTCGYYPEIQSIQIYGGEIIDLEPFIQRGSFNADGGYYNLIEGITPDKFYTVTGLTPGTSYLYRVMAFYVNGTRSVWSNTREVILLQGESIPGDVNKDGIVDINDVTALLDSLMSGDTEMLDPVAADLNGDGLIDIEDATLLVDALMNAK